MAEPFQGQAFTYYTTLWSGSLPVTNPTISAGDFVVSKDGSAFINLNTLPTVVPAGGIQVKIDLSASEMSAEAVMIIWDDPDDTWETDGIVIFTIDQASSGLTASDVWSYGTRTLTMTATEIENALTGANLSLIRGDTYTVSITGLGDLTGYDAILMTAKDDYSAADSEALFQVRLNNPSTSDGLIYAWNLSSPTASYGSITVDNLTAGNITVYIDEEITKYFPVANYHYDIQLIRNSVVTTLVIAELAVTEDYTRVTT